ncbi:hypothetical protein BASA82_000137 [Batrachochytrium salamandrivorans]|nr:hypothetical protein BASA81_001629 [Batrachochytrium salamandrivorans]KAH9262845.1 hypothetical protein BASA82_000137 [Batrachochytrium salamandrivorans]
MPKFALELRAELENVTEVVVSSPLVLSLRQSGGTEERHDVEVDPNEEEAEVFGSKGTAHFVMKWDKKDKFEATLKVISPISPLTESSKWTRIVTFETRGLDVVKYTPKSALVVGVKDRFPDADISDLQDGFSEYDEKAELAVGLTELECRIVAI